MGRYMAWISTCGGIKKNGLLIEAVLAEKLRSLRL